jgi:hypothetical protein
MFSTRHRATLDPLVDTLRQVLVRADLAGYAASVAVLCGAYQKRSFQISVFPC